MTLEEFSNEFDVLVQQGLISSQTNDMLTFNEYEKSVFLTNAQEDIIKDIYSGRNRFVGSFEETEEARRYLDGLIKTYSTSDKITSQNGLSESSVFFRLPDDLWFITYEHVDLNDDKLGCLSGKGVLVIPITQDEYYRIKNNPFRGANERRVLRLDSDEDIVELISKYNIDKYTIRYLSKPSPIVLVNLPEDLSIDGVRKETECKLNPVIHRTILERAVRTALMSRSTVSGN